MSKTMDHKQWEILKEQASVLLKSGFLPPAIKTLEQAIAIGVKSWELDLPLMQGYSGISIVQNKPTIGAELMLSLIYKNCPGSVVEFTKLTDTGCELVARRPGGKAQTFKFDEGDARKAGLLRKGPWLQFPRAMYRSRAISECARSLFPDAIMGASYTPEELGSQPSVPEYINDVPPITEEFPQSPVMDLVKKEPTKKAFSKDSSEHRKGLDMLLKKRSVPKSDWAKVYEAMDGKPSSDLDKVIEGLRSVYKDIMTGEDTPYSNVKDDSIDNQQRKEA